MANLRYYTVYFVGEGPTKEQYVRLHELGVTCAFCYADYGHGVEVAACAEEGVDVNAAVGASQTCVFFTENAEAGDLTVHGRTFVQALDSEPLHIEGF